MNYDYTYLETPYHRNLRERKFDTFAARVRALLQFAMFAATIAIFAWLAIQLGIIS